MVDTCWKKHSYSEWYKLKQDERKSNRKPPHVALTEASPSSTSHVSRVSHQEGNSSLVLLSSTNNTWVIDLGAIDHMTADSTFKEEDILNYFSIYGPVQDVRIPYQQKRMFGFVTFVYPETVKLILAKRNPHFMCDPHVLVKPYKEKGKVPEKKQHQQQMERGEYSACYNPSGPDFMILSTSNHIKQQ
ncbi:hypothetical protein LWI29_010558 [Acer saccharum]|uniref:RRM domain-containing protein n=1 Tax=Acer saccharum TaxID=4024 RepID=A0AA39VPE5_ACESA|nr:hypothetical protein LWI29_010558 [Acer saccharum]